MKRTLAAAAVLIAAPAVALAVREGSRPDPNAQATADGCRRDNGAIFQHTVPNWAYVNDAGTAANAAPPPQQWATGVLKPRFSRWAGARPTPIDDPLTHTAYDFNMNIRVDRRHAFLVGGVPAQRTGNFKGENEQTGALHAEWQEDAFPKFAWPETGDRVAVRGAWVWDCDHTTGGERTELHPLSAVWVVRSGASPNSPLLAREADLYVSTDGTHAYRQALCAHRTKGGATAFRACVNARHPDIQTVNGSYNLFLPAPPRPSAASRLLTHVVDRGSRNAPRVRLARRANGVFIRFRVAARTGRRVVVAKQLFARWTPGGAPLVHLRVSFGWLVVRRGLDPVSRRSGQNTTSPGEWLAYADVHGVWRPLWPGIRYAADHSVIRLRRDVDFYVRRGGRWRLAIFTRECDLGAIGNAYAPGRGRVFPCPHTQEVGALAGDDDPGVAIAWHGTGRGSIGGYELNSRLEPSTCPRTVVHGCYAIAYRVERLPR